MLPKEKFGILGYGLKGWMQRFIALPEMDSPERTYQLLARAFQFLGKF